MTHLTLFAIYNIFPTISLPILVPTMFPTPTVVAVSAQPTHSFTKPNLDSITLIAGEGVFGDAHSGETVKHLYPSSDSKVHVGFE